MPMIATPLQLNHAGHFKPIHVGTTTRLDPVDFLLIWVTRGGTHATVAGQPVVAGPGDLLTFEPQVPQHYEPDSRGDWEWLWVHFGGPAAADLVRALRGPSGSPVVHLGLDDRLRDRFLELVIAAPPGVPGSRPAPPAHEPHRNLLADAALLHLLALMLDRLGRLQLRGTGPDHQALDLPAFQRYVHDHLAEPMTVQALARHAKLSPAHFTRLVRRSLGVAPMQYVIGKRMDRAATLLTQTPMKLTAIAEAVGYDDPYYFSRLFKKVTGVSPSAYRNRAADE